MTKSPTKKCKSMKLIMEKSNVMLIIGLKIFYFPIFQNSEVVISPL